MSLVTGATGGMGRVIATELARLGSTVVIVARTVAGGEQARRQIAAEAGGGRVELLTGDLASLADLRRVADRFTARHRALHVLVNNAGAHYRQRSENADGIEMHLAVNHLAGFSLTNLLLEPLRAGAPSRVVNVVSAAMADTRQIKIRRMAATGHARPRRPGRPASDQRRRRVRSVRGLRPREAAHHDVRIRAGRSTCATQPSP